MKQTFNLILLSEQSYFEQIILQTRIYKFLWELNFEYPKFSIWYNNLFFEQGILKPNREIVVCMYQNILVGVSILKNDLLEKKICTLRVARPYQNLGIGKALMEKSFECLDDDKPLITIHISKFHDFKNIFDRYGFKVEQEILGCYGFLKSEIIYNGILENDIENSDVTVKNKISYNLEKILYNYDSTEKNIVVTDNRPLDLIVAKY
ncbi:MAG: GNAT family N-acetyltransferase [Clostridia bacterium]|nr:GNAT family N-acetyltransferase [Clostridia bacterium]